MQLCIPRIARSNAYAAHSCPAFCCTAYSKSPETGFRIAGNHGASLAATSSSNNIQIVYIDARHPPWSLPKVHEGDGSSRVYLAGPRALLFCRDPELYDIRRLKLKFGERAFAVAAPKAWNSLPDSLKQINDTVKFLEKPETPFI